ncbi:hypothetical protein EJD97_023501 [Solanum chilense]|uniref:Uncharacterized protein n=1 Tax=Solanum chilense TaxID=4083 RepID=A0A6N2C8C0_SOLCI|nr:hypothetical protein EJD97_023501 [Solanum chilense]
MTEEIVMNSTNNIDNHKKTPMDDIIVKHKKKQGAFGFLRAASLKFRRRSLDLKQQKFTPEPAPPVDSKGENWKKLVGSMRPLHLQDNQSPPSPRDTQPPPPAKTTSLPVEFSEQFSSMYSPTPSTSSISTMSQYASANNLQDLYDDDEEEEEEDPDQVFDAIGGDDMIDAKAENFIAQFYEQMRLQK